MAIYKGRSVRLEVAMTYDAADVVDAVTQANPAVITSTAHGWANGDVGYLGSVTGMSQLDGQAIRAANVAANTLEAEGVDSTNYPAFTAGNLLRVGAWATIAQATDFTIGGGDADKLDATTLLDFIKQEEVGLLAAETVNVNMLADPLSQAVQRLRALALQSQRANFRISYPANALEIYWFGEPSIPGFSQQKQQLATGGFSVTVKGFMLFL